MIRVSHLTHVFDGTAEDAPPTLEDINFTVADGEFVALVGPSGCGKTTLLNLIAGLEPLRSADSVEVGGHAPRAGDPDTGYMLSRDCLLPSRRALANAALGLEVRRVPKRERETRARAALAAVGLADHATRYPAELSQGMRQRVALARVFAVKPETLLLDEPFSALDPQTRISVQDAFLGLWQEQRTSVVLVTHDLSEAITLADRVLVLSRLPGRLKADHRIDLPRPRSAAELRATPAFHALYEKIWLDLKDEVVAADTELLSTGR
jgi:NitT/TauT family transport system ATP-binding protein